MNANSPEWGKVKFKCLRSNPRLSWLVVLFTQTSPCLFSLPKSTTSSFCALKELKKKGYLFCSAFQTYRNDFQTWRIIYSLPVGNPHCWLRGEKLLAVCFMRLCSFEGQGGSWTCLNLLSFGRRRQSESVNKNPQGWLFCFAAKCAPV